MTVVNARYRCAKNKKGFSCNLRVQHIAINHDLSESFHTNGFIMSLQQRRCIQHLHKCLRAIAEHILRHLRRGKTFLRHKFELFSVRQNFSLPKYKKKAFIKKSLTERLLVKYSALSNWLMVLACILWTKNLWVESLTKMWWNKLSDLSKKSSKFLSVCYAVRVRAFNATYFFHVILSVF